MTLEIILYPIIFLYGLVIGSFLNVCIYRIPKNEDLIKKRSHCMQCGYQLKWYDLVPLFSWCFLGGRCRNCKTKISMQYPVIELVNGLLYLLIFYVNGLNLISVLYCFMASALVVLSMIDFRTFEIPFGINLFLLALGLIRLGMDLTHWATYVIGLFLVSGILYLIIFLTKGKGMGGGDAKLMAACGLILGGPKILLAFVLGCILGSVIHLLRMLISKEQHVLAFGPYLAMGIFIAALWGDGLIRLYLQYLGV